MENMYERTVNHAINHRTQLQEVVELEQRWVLHGAAMCFSTTVGTNP